MDNNLSKKGRFYDIMSSMVAAHAFPNKNNIRNSKEIKQLSRSIYQQNIYTRL